MRGLNTRCFASPALLLLGKIEGPCVAAVRNLALLVKIKLEEQVQYCARWRVATPSFDGFRLGAARRVPAVLLVFALRQHHLKRFPQSQLGPR